MSKNQNIVNTNNLEETYLECQQKEFEPGLSPIYAPFPIDTFFKVALTALAEYHNVPLQ
jgi:hypothetical protein